jgi:hypothetical protein
MWLVDERGALVNLDYVTGIEPSAMKSFAADGESMYEITAYRSGPGADWIVLTMVDHRTAFGIMTQLAKAMSDGQSVVDIRVLAGRQREAVDRS